MEIVAINLLTILILKKIISTSHVFIWNVHMKVLRKPIQFYLKSFFAASFFNGRYCLSVYIDLQLLSLCFRIHELNIF